MTNVYRLTQSKQRKLIFPRNSEDIHSSLDGSPKKNLNGNLDKVAQVLKSRSTWLPGVPWRKLAVWNFPTFPLDRRGLDAFPPLSPFFSAGVNPSQSCCCTKVHIASVKVDKVFQSSQTNYSSLNLHKMCPDSFFCFQNVCQFWFAFPPRLIVVKHTFGCWTTRSRRWGWTKDLRFLSQSAIDCKSDSTDDRRPRVSNCSKIVARNIFGLERWRKTTSFILAINLRAAVTSQWAQRLFRVVTAILKLQKLGAAPWGIQIVATTYVKLAKFVVSFSNWRRIFLTSARVLSWNDSWVGFGWSFECEKLTRKLLTSSNWRKAKTEFSEG